ncbi:MAG: ferritin-like domain-containing protein [Myxococcales bacterium]|nr:ferritin-like domain-containing protein [Myxococcales bacterium]
MGIAGFGKTEIRYDMFALEQSADEAKRLVKCESIYHRGQEMAWDGKDILKMLVDKHGGIHVAPEKKEALKRIFAIILWGELAAWKISAQLADGLAPLEAKMAATSQAHDEARHFYVMYDYLRALDYVPARLDRAPQALLDLVLDTKNLAYKLLGMQLMIEPIALTVFQTVRETGVEPVLCELMTYYERDEARHVGLGMQYLPSLIKGMTKAQVGALLTFQVRLLAWAVWENKVLEKDLAVLGVDPRALLERGRKKQLAALAECFNALKIPAERTLPAQALNAVIEVMFPTEETKGSAVKRLRAAWRAWKTVQKGTGAQEFDVHNAHAIRTARGVLAGERAAPVAQA